MNINLIPTDLLVKKYGTHSDGIYIWKGEKRIGFISDLRVQYAKDLSQESSLGGFGWRKPKPVRRLGRNSFGPDGLNKF